MAPLRAVGVVAALSCVLAPTHPADAGSLDACAQRVIRDWYSGGRVDRIYPLACYRAAIRALPEDVLQYSNADRDIARALAYARSGRADSTPPRSALEGRSSRPGARTEEAAPTSVAAAARQRLGAPVAARDDPGARLASSPATETVSAALPYPVIVLAALSVVLLLTGGTGWLVSRRR